MPAIDRDDPIWEEINQIATYSVRAVARRYADYTTADDLRQHVMEYAWKRNDKVAEYLLRDDENERRRGVGALSVLFKRSAERYARKEKAAKLGYAIEDEFFYRTDLVERLISILPYGVEGAGQALNPDGGTGRKTNLPNEGGNILAMVADIESGLKFLEPRLTYILEARYAEGQTLQQIADTLELSVQRVDQLSRKAMKELIEFLGGESPY